jgi:hypothetical protein
LKSLKTPVPELDTEFRNWIANVVDMEQLSMRWPDGVEPVLLKKYGLQLFKAIPATAKASRHEFPTIDAVAQGPHAPKQFGTHDEHHRTMCLPCMSFANDKAAWGSIDRPDTRKERRSARRSPRFTSSRLER